MSSENFGHTKNLAMRFSVVVGQGRPGSSWRFQPLLWQIPAEFCAFLWSRILLVAALDSLDSLQGGEIVYFARVSLGRKSRKLEMSAMLEWTGLPFITATY